MSIQHPTPPRPLSTDSQRVDFLQGRFQLPNKDIAPPLTHNTPVLPIADYLNAGRSSTNEHQMFYNLFNPHTLPAVRIIKSGIIQEKHDFITKLVLPFQEVGILAWEETTWYIDFSIADDLPMESLARQVSASARREEIRLQRKGMEIRFHQSELNDPTGREVVKAKMDQVIINLHTSLFLIGLLALVNANPKRTMFLELLGDPTQKGWSTYLKTRRQFFGIGSVKYIGEKTPFSRIIHQAQNVITQKGQQPATVLILPPGAEKMVDCIAEPKKVFGYMYEKDNPTPREVEVLDSLFTTSTGVKAFIVPTPYLHDNQLGLARHLNMLLGRSIVSEFYRMTSVHGMVTGVERDPKDKDVQIYDLAKDDWVHINFCDALVHSGIFQEIGVDSMPPTSPNGDVPPRYEFSSHFVFFLKDGKGEKHNLFSRFNEVTGKWMPIETIGQMDQKFIGEGLKITADDIARKFSVIYQKSSPSGFVSPSSAIVSGLMIRNRIAAEPYEEAYFQAVAAANLNNQPTGVDNAGNITYMPIKTPKKVLDRYRSGTEFSVPEWQQQPNGSLKIPVPDNNLSFNAKYPPGAINFCNLVELSSHSIDKSSYWYELGSQLKPFVNTITELSQMLTTMLPHSKLIKLSAIPAYIHSNDPSNALAEVFLSPPPLWLSPPTTLGPDKRPFNVSSINILNVMIPQNYMDFFNKLSNNAGRKMEEIAKKILEDSVDDRNFDIPKFIYHLSKVNPEQLTTEQVEWNKFKKAMLDYKFESPLVQQSSKTSKKKTESNVLPVPDVVKPSSAFPDSPSISPWRTSFAATPGIIKTIDMNNNNFVFFSDEDKLNLTHMGNEKPDENHPALKFLGSELDITQVYKNIHGVKFVENKKMDMPSEDPYRPYSRTRKRKSAFDPVESVSMHFADRGFGYDDYDDMKSVQHSDDFLKTNFIGAKLTLNEVKKIHEKNVAERYDKTVVQNLLLHNTCQDSVTKIILLALIASDHPVDTLLRLCKNNVYIPVDIILTRPQMVLEMLAAILCGENIGKTYLADQNIYPSFKTGVYEVQFNFYTGANVNEKKRVVVFNDAFHSDWYSGCSTEYFNFETHALDNGLENAAMRKKSLIPMIVGPLSNLRDEMLFLAQERHSAPEYPKVETGAFYDRVFQISKISLDFLSNIKLNMVAPVDYVLQQGDNRTWNPRLGNWEYNPGSSELGHRMKKGCLTSFQGNTTFTFSTQATPN